MLAGMHRDKGGAAAIAGFMRTLALLQPAGLKVRCGRGCRPLAKALHGLGFYSNSACTLQVVAKLAMVRNSIGADAYVADEIIRSRAGVRTRVGNTDAEGKVRCRSCKRRGWLSVRSAIIVRM